MQQAANDRPYSRNEESNPLGIAGFVVSLVGLVASCGLLSPIGAVLSLVAMSKRPKGLAIAGFVLGLIGSLWIVALIVGVVVLGVGGVAAMIGLGPVFEVAFDQAEIRNAMRDYRAEHGALPASLDDLTGLDPDVLTDHWGSAYRLEYTDNGETPVIISDGPDKQKGTDDDIRLEFGPL